MLNLLTNNEHFTRLGVKNIYCMKVLHKRRYSSHLMYKKIAQKYMCIYIERERERIKTSSCHKFLYTCYYMLPICILLQSIQMDLYSIKYKFKLLVITSFQHLLYNIVRKLIFHHHLNP